MEKNDGSAREDAAQESRDILNVRNERYAVVICEGGMVRHTEEPEGVELVYLDYDDLSHNDLDLRSMAGFERCTGCSHAKELHREGRCVPREAACSGWRPTGFLVDDRPMTDLEGYEPGE